MSSSTAYSIKIIESWCTIKTFSIYWTECAAFWTNIHTISICICPLSVSTSFLQYTNTVEKLKVRINTSQTFSIRWVKLSTKCTYINTNIVQQILSRVAINLLYTVSWRQQEIILNTFNTNTVIVNVTEWTSLVASAIFTQILSTKTCERLVNL